MCHLSGKSHLILFLSYSGMTICGKELGNQQQYIWQSKNNINKINKKMLKVVGWV